jgi:hypothetical protein
VSRGLKLRRRVRDRVGMRHRCDFSYVLVLAMTTAAGSLQRVFAQEALRSALQTDASARLRERPVTRPAEDTLRIGPVTFDIGMGYSLEASDNIMYAETDRKSDLIQRPSLNLGIAYRGSHQSRLNLNVGFGYEDYIDNSENDRFYVAPGSEVALDARIGSSTVTVFERFDYSQDVASEGALSGVARFPRLQNTVGLRSVWKFGKWVWQADYSHLNVIATGEASSIDSFDHLERADEQFFGRAAHTFDFPVQAGVEASGSLSAYALPIQRDRYTISVGPFLNWTAADALEVAVHGGLARTVFQSTNSAMEDSDLASYYVGFQVNHRLTQHITYGFSATHDIQAGINMGSDYIESTRLAFDVIWKMLRHLQLGARVFGEDSKEANVSQVSGPSGGDEKYRRTGASLNASYELTQHLTLFSRYAFVVKDSDQDGRSYHENRVTLGANYRY